MPMIITVIIIYILTYLPIQVFPLSGMKHNIGPFVFVSHSMVISVIQVVVSELCSFLRVVMLNYDTLCILVISFLIDIGIVSTLGCYDQVSMAIHVQVYV